MITPVYGSGTTGGSIAAVRSLRSQGAAEEEATTLYTEPDEPAPTTGDTIAQGTVTASATASETETTVEPPGPLGDVMKKYVGLASSKEKRMNVLPPNSRRKSSNKPKAIRRRKKGLPSDSVGQQADAFSMEASHEAMMAVMAKAIDTISLPGRGDHDPSHTIALIILNEVVETNTVGGDHNSYVEASDIWIKPNRLNSMTYELLLPLKRGPEPLLAPAAIFL